MPRCLRALTVLVGDLYSHCSSQLAVYLVPEDLTQSSRLCRNKTQT